VFVSLIMSSLVSKLLILIHLFAIWCTCNKLEFIKLICIFELNKIVTQVQLKMCERTKKRSSKKLGKHMEYCLILRKRRATTVVKILKMRAWVDLMAVIYCVAWYWGLLQFYLPTPSVTINFHETGCAKTPEAPTQLTFYC